MIESAADPLQGLDLGASDRIGVACSNDRVMENVLHVRKLLAESGVLFSREASFRLVTHGGALLTPVGIATRALCHGACRGWSDTAASRPL